MKKVFLGLILVLVLVSYTGFSDNTMELKHIQYLDKVLSTNTVNLDSLSKYGNIDKEYVKDFSKLIERNQRISYGVKFTITESLLNKIKSIYAKHPALRKFDIFLRDNKIILDIVYYVDILDLEIPFTAKCIPFVSQNNVISLDVTEMKVWSEGNLPTHKILPKLLKFINKQTRMPEIVELKYKEVPATRAYKSYGRILVINKTAKFSPMLSKIVVNGIKATNKEVTVYAK